MRSVLAVSVVAVALLAAGCGSSDSSGDEATPTEEWASSVCSALTTWSEAIKEVGTTLQASPTVDGLENAADQAKSATETLVDDLQEAGRPDTEAGQEAQDALQTASDDLSSSIDEIESATNDVSGVSGVVAAATAIGTTIATMGTTITTLFSSLEDLDAKGELEDAFTSASSCDSIGS